MKNRKVYISIQKALQQAILKLDDTEEWLKVIPGKPKWLKKTKGSIESFEKEIFKFFKSQKKIYIKETKKLKLPVKKGVDEKYVKQFKEEVEKALLNKDKDFISKLKDIGYLAFEENMSDVAKIVAKELNTEINFNLLSKEALKWLKNKTIQFAKQVQETTYNSVHDSLVDGFKEGESIEDLAKRIKDLPEFGFKRARVVARTEILSSSNGGILEGFRQSKVVVGKEWSSANNGRTRQSHKDVNKQIKKIEEPFVIYNSKKGTTSKLMHPGDGSLGAAAYEIIQCRCTMYPILDTEWEEKKKGG